MISIDGHHLGIADVVSVARGNNPVEIAPEGLENIERSRAWLESVLATDRPVYGINTGFGIFADRRISLKDSKQLSRNLILSHAVGTGPALDEEIVRAAMLVRANTLAKGYSGIRRELVQTMLWATQRQQAGVLLYNFSQYPIPTVQEYAETIQKVAGIRRRVFQAPYALLYPMSWAMDSCARLFGLNQPVNPTRLRKLIRSNNIVPAVLQSEQYQNRFDLESALRDWKSERPEDWR